MENIEIKRLFQHVSSFECGLNEDAYYRQVYMLYGVLNNLDAMSPDVFKELLEIEEKRVLRYGISIEKRITDPRSLISEYSTIAFYLAQKSLDDNKVYRVAPYLKSIISQLYSSECLSLEEKKLLRNLVSETELDFSFASGNHDISSLRMAPIIKDYNARNGGNR